MQRITAVIRVKENKRPFYIFIYIHKNVYVFFFLLINSNICWKKNEKSHSSTSIKLETDAKVAFKTEYSPSFRNPHQFVLTSQSSERDIKAETNAPDLQSWDPRVFFSSSVACQVNSNTSQRPVPRSSRITEQTGHSL